MRPGAGGATNLALVATMIRKMVEESAQILIIPHAREEMSRDHINSVDIKYALRGCACVMCEQHGFSEWRATCRGRTRQGELVEIVTRIFKEENLLQVVTAYSVR
jgi:NMD protein affecting ribosome stability and mRNA decay